MFGLESKIPEVVEPENPMNQLIKLLTPEVVSMLNKKAAQSGEEIDWTSPESISSYIIDDDTEDDENN